MRALIRPRFAASTFSRKREKGWGEGRPHQRSLSPSAPDREASDQMARVARISASRGSARTLALAARMTGSRRATESDVQRSA